MFEITEKQILNSSTVLLTIKAPLVAAKALPGQFVMVRTGSEGERIPLTIENSSKQNGTVSIVFQAIGATTKKLAALEVGGYVDDVVGPLGEPTNLSGIKNAAVIGGGVGCAIALPQATYLHASGAKVTIIAGFRSKDLVILEEEMAKNCSKFMLTTDDGSYGTQGFVTNVLEQQILDGQQFDTVIAIGPVPMMRAVCKVTKKYGIKTIVSLNPIMIDGTGMCGCCRVTVGGQTKFACVDGPDFDGHEVDFDELMRRNGTYKEIEQQHVGRLTGVENV